jgi:hypothetical protein
MGTQPRPDPDPAAEFDDPFARRVSENQVARILQLIATLPNCRERPAAGDMAGDYTFWFDGGACQEHTGSQHYIFADGSTAFVAFPVAWLWVDITFPNGESVRVLQQRRT